MFNDYKDQYDKLEQNGKALGFIKVMNGLSADISTNLKTIPEFN
jgi:hypothetical protein